MFQLFLDMLGFLGCLVCAALIGTVALIFSLFVICSIKYLSNEFKEPKNKE